MSESNGSSNNKITYREFEDHAVVDRNSNNDQSVGDPEEVAMVEIPQLGPVDGYSGVGNVNYSCVTSVKRIEANGTLEERLLRSIMYNC